MEKGAILLSLDATYTSHRNEGGTTLAGHGKKTPTARITSQFTNCIITAVLSDGMQLPSIMFTYNPKFKPVAGNRKRQKANLTTLQEELLAAGVTADRVVYMESPKGKQKYFMRETNALFLKFLNFHKETLQGLGTVIYFSDGGNAFKDGKESIIEKNNFGKHYMYPSCVHQFLSPNDNALHGVCVRFFSCDVDLLICYAMHIF